VAAGHIEKAPRRHGQRGRYVLLSQVFGQKQRGDFDAVAMGPGGRPRLVSVRKDQGTAWTPVSRAIPNSTRKVGGPRQSVRRPHLGIDLETGND
jgi:hypothetical protein